MTPAIESEPRSDFPELTGTRRFTADEYGRMLTASVIGPDEPVEFRDGYVLNRAGYAEPSADDVFPEWRALRRFTPAEYHRMYDLGIIRGEKLELLDGYLVLKMAQKPSHRSALMRLLDRLPASLPPGWTRMTSCTVATDLFEPEPDVIVVRGEMTDYDARNPTTADFGIAIEVSDSSLEGDRARKGKLFAKVGIPVYWIVNVADKQIEVYTDPTANGYTNRANYKPGDNVPITLDGVAAGAVAVSDIIV